MNHSEIIDWLLQGDISIQFQTKRDLLEEEDLILQNQISKEGWGKILLSKQNENGHWGQRFYQPKWISTHYTLLDLRNLWISPDNEQIREVIERILDEEKGKDGGMLPSGKLQLSDVCVSGMVLNYASYFKATSAKLESIVDSILEERMNDGGFNCMSNRYDTVHSSLHSTLSVCEGISEYINNGYQYRISELKEAKQSSIEFMLRHQLFLSDRTGEIIQKEFTKLVYPPRWKYNVLRALDFLRKENVEWDERMTPAIELIIRKRNKMGTWNAQSKHAGQVHFEMEKAGKPGRWNTLHALRVFKHYRIE